MREPKHTPLPWSSDDGYLGAPNWASVPLRPSHLEWVTNPGGNRYDEAMANAALIVERVNGWDALVAENGKLRAALQQIMEDNEQESHPCGPQQYGHFGTLARAALSARSLEVE